MKRAGGGGGGGDGGQGEIIQVQGGHIVRATGRKDRHSKVYTSKGPRDRRVRLSAHTAIQFYDVQDRLGYDRPSKAVDWLIKKAKNAIDKLDELPPHHPNEIGMVVAAAPSTDSNPGSSGQALEQRSESSSVYAIHRHLPDDQNGNPGVIPGAVDTQSIADTMKSFFPVNPGNSLMNLQSYPGNDRMSRQPSFQTEDLGLSLHSLQDHQNLNHRSYNTEQMLFLGSNPTMFADQEANYQQKTESWSGAGEGENRNNNGFIFNSHSMPQQMFFSQNSAFSQREPLQSNNYSHLFHAWNERQMPSVEHHNPQAITQSSIYNVHFGSNFQVPARIRGDEEPGVGTLQPSSISPSSNH